MYKHWPLAPHTLLADIPIERCWVRLLASQGVFNIRSLLLLGSRRLCKRLNIEEEALRPLKINFFATTGHALMVIGREPKAVVTEKTMAVAKEIEHRSKFRDFAGEVEDYFREINRQPPRCRQAIFLDDENHAELLWFMWGAHSTTMPSVRVGTDRRSRRREKVADSDESFEHPDI